MSDLESLKALVKAHLDAGQALDMWMKEKG